MVTVWSLRVGMKRHTQTRAHNGPVWAVPHILLIHLESVSVSLTLEEWEGRLELNSLSFLSRHQKRPALVIEEDLKTERRWRRCILLSAQASAHPYAKLLMHFEVEVSCTKKQLNLVVYPPLSYVPWSSAHIMGVTNIKYKNPKNSSLHRCVKYYCRFTYNSILCNMLHE